MRVDWIIDIGLPPPVFPRVIPVIATSVAVAIIEDASVPPSPGPPPELPPNVVVWKWPASVRGWTCDGIWSVVAAMDCAPAAAPMSCASLNIEERQLTFVPTAGIVEIVIFRPFMAVTVPAG